MSNEQHVFLSYAADDKSAARDIYRALTEAGLDVWFDEASIVPGMRWDITIKNELDKAKAVLLLVGAKPPGQWQLQEIKSVLAKTIKDTSFEVIPVLLPGADIEALPAELRAWTFIDFRTTADLVKEIQKLFEVTRVGSRRDISDEENIKLEVAAMEKVADTLQARGMLDEALCIRREEQLPVFEQLGDVRSRAITLGKIADILQMRGDLDEALRIRREEELPVYERLGDVRSRAVTLGQIADILQARGELDEALRIRREEQLPVFERLGDIRERAVTLGQIGDILQARGELDEALRIRREEELPVYERLGDVRSRAVTLGQVANILQIQGAQHDAVRILREDVIPVFERIGDVRSLVFAQTNLALFLLSQKEPGEREEAADLLHNTLRIARRIGLPESKQIQRIVDELGMAP